MDFKAATDELTKSGSITLTRVAEAFGITLNSISRMRSGALRPPRNWEVTIAKLATEHARDMVDGANELKELASALSSRGE